MLVYCVDDSALHLSRITKAVELAIKTKGGASCHIVECMDGDQLLEEVSRNRPDLITLDINMPNLDGLSALVKLRHKRMFCSIIMVTSESDVVIRRLAKINRFNADEKKKREMLKKVVERVEAGKEELGKINSVLEACANLGMDPLEVAKQYGANGFIQKPYEIDEASRKILEFV